MSKVYFKYRFKFEESKEIIFDVELDKESLDIIKRREKKYLTGAKWRASDAAIAGWMKKLSIVLLLLIFLIL